MEDKITLELYSNYMKFTETMSEKYDALAIAGIMTAQALSIYRTVLSEEDYNQMIDNISDSRDLVHTFQGRDLQ
jgi:hypothetical protein